MGTGPGAEQRPEPFKFVDLHPGGAISGVMTDVLARLIAGRLVIVNPVDPMGVDVRVIGGGQNPLAIVRSISNPIVV